jgi:hypothetical protein
MAHKPSDSYLTLAADGAVLTGRWDIALRDLDLALGLDADGDGRITWGEVRSRHADIAAWPRPTWCCAPTASPVRWHVGPQQVDEHTDGAYSVLPLTGTCPPARRPCWTSATPCSPTWTRSTAACSAWRPMAPPGLPSWARRRRSRPLRWPR